MFGVVVYSRKRLISSFHALFCSVSDWFFLRSTFVFVAVLEYTPE